MNECVLVLLPGLDGTGRLFEPLIGLLPSWLKPIVISYPTDHFLDYSELRGYVLSRLPVDRPFLILGESFGGPLALEIAATHPKHLVGVILCATFVTNPTRIPPGIGHLLFNPLLFAIYPPAFVVRWFLVGFNASKALVRLVQEVLRSTNARVMSLRTWTVLRVDARDLLLRCDVPLLYLRATNDKIAKVEALDTIRAVAPDINVVTIKAPHFILQREPGEATHAIEPFALRVLSAEF